MNRKIAILLLALFSVICLTGFVSCKNDVDDNPQGEPDKTYTVTWKNDNGDVLKTDSNIKEGSVPAYDGATPTKSADEQYSYVFAGWEPQVSEVHADVTYTATFTSTVNKYTVTWKNYNGEVLETDNDVLYGTTPSYDGAKPKKAGTAEVSYVFAGWTPSIDKVTGNVTYTAQFTERQSGNLVLGVDPILSQDGKTIKYGFYPQTHVNDEALIAELNALTPCETNGWYLYNGEYYAKQTAKVYNKESYTFDDGTAIVNGNEYWFKCEVIEWQVLNCDDGTYYLLSSKLLDVHNYYADYSNRTTDGNTVYANNYEQSAIRNWLNDYFYNTAFALNNEYVQQTSVNNGASTTDVASNVYACANTQDKVYLPSYLDYSNADYGFDSNADNTSSTRECKTTDFARAMGAWYNTTNNLQYNGSYWTRSPSSEYYYCAWNVNSGGLLSEYAVDGDSHCVRPCISVIF